MTGTVKALEWEAYPGANEVMTEGYGQRRQYLERALFGFGAYCLMVKDGRYSVKSDYMDGPEYDTGEAAKAAAQADYERRVLSALTASASEPAKPEMWQWREVRSNRHSPDDWKAGAWRDGRIPSTARATAFVRFEERALYASPVPASEPEPVASSAIENIATEIDAEWRRKGGLNCTEVCAIVRSAAITKSVPTPDGAVAVSMTPEEHRLEDLKQMAAYSGPIVSFECREPYYLASCDHCGWVGSSELCGTDSFGDDSDVYCPRCHSSGADCGKVAESLSAALSHPADGWRDIATAPTGWGNFFFVRPRGIHHSGKPFLPTIVQFVDGEFYTPENELDPVYFGQNEPEDSSLKSTLEWFPIPQGWITAAPAAKPEGE